jgi:hypothetical protein
VIREVSLEKHTMKKSKKARLSASYRPKAILTFKSVSKILNGKKTLYYALSYFGTTVTKY